MAIVNLENRQFIADQLTPALATFKQEMDKLLPIWEKLTLEQKTRIIQDERDPVLNLAVQTGRYLYRNFFKEFLKTEDQL
jgi:hypothetical protein